MYVAFGEVETTQPEHFMFYSVAVPCSGPPQYAQRLGLSPK